jgi:hypothetical protein
MRTELWILALAGVIFFLLPLFFSKEKTYQVACPACKQNSWNKTEAGYKCASCKNCISPEGCGGQVQETWQDTCFDGSCIEHCNQTRCGKEGYLWYTLGPSPSVPGPLYLLPSYPSTSSWWRWQVNPWSRTWWTAWDKSGV